MGRAMSMAQSKYPAWLTGLLVLLCTVLTWLGTTTFGAGNNWGALSGRLNTVEKTVASIADSVKTHIDVTEKAQESRIAAIDARSTANLKSNTDLADRLTSMHIESRQDHDLLLRIEGSQKALEGGMLSMKESVDRLIRLLDERRSP